MKSTILCGKEVSKTYTQSGKETQILTNIDLELYEGDFTVIMGSSGAGKSTLLYVLSGMDAITAGSVIFNGQEISSFSEKKMAQLRANEFGFIFQQPHLVSNLTLFENVAVAGYAAKAGSVKEIREKADMLLVKMHAEGAKDRLPSQVSGGEAQRAAIARAMIGNPRLLFADEPTGALNKANSEEVMNLLMELNHDGQSILMVTHDVRAALYGNRILYLEDGKILDECNLSPYGRDNLKDRENKALDWLSGLGW